VTTPGWAVAVAGLVVVGACGSLTRRLANGGALLGESLGLFSPPARHGPLHGVSARLKLLGVFALACAASLTPLVRLWVAGVLVGGLLVVSRLPLSTILARLGELMPFVALAAVGALLRGDAALFALVLSRAVLTVAALVLLLATTPLPLLVEAARRLGLPPVLASTLALALRYLALLSDEGSRLALAFDARAVGPRDLRLARPLGRVVGSLALRALDRGERIGQAMAARGFAGTFPTLEPELRSDWRQRLGFVSFVVALGIAAWPR